MLLSKINNLFVFMIICLGISACTVVPLESPSGHSSNLKSSVLLASPETRLDQKLRNALIELQGRSNNDSKFKFSAKVTKQTLGTVAERGSGENRIAKVTLTADYVLTNIDTGQDIDRGKRSATVSFDRSVSQVFANERAEEDAETRAAQLLALKLRSIIKINTSHSVTSEN